MVNEDAALLDRPVSLFDRRLQAQAACQNSGGALNTVVADSGYDNNHQIYELEKRLGVRAVVGVQDPHQLGENYVQNRRRNVTRSLKIQRLKELATLEGRELMCKRQGSVETVFGTIKHTMKFREFLTRGRDNVANEWNLVSAAYNLKRLMNLRA